MIMKRLGNLLLLLVLLSGLSACGGSSGGDAADVVERYLTAKVASDTDAMRPLLCSAMEAQLSREASSFATVEGARIEGMDCTANGETVTCTGKILAEYGLETTEFPLSAYSVVQEDGEWKWCGEAE